MNGKYKKNIPGNEETFKDVITSELADVAEVSGNNDGPLTVIFYETDNAYKISQDGTINETVKLSGTNLEKYIFGKDLNGRDFEEIFKNYAFVDDEDTISNASTDLEYVSREIIEPIKEELYLVNNYVKYDGKLYRFKATYSVDSSWNTSSFTISDYGLTEIEAIGEKVGKIVSYAGKTWTILYDDDTNGLQMISNEVYEYNKGNFNLGYNDSSITDWTELNTKTDEFKFADLNGNGSLDDNLEKAIYSYNNAIITLKNACKSVVTTNENIIDVRCVGSDPIEKDSETADRYTSDNFKKWPEGNSTYTSGIANGKIKVSDANYIKDYERMLELGICVAKDDAGKKCKYLLASRMLELYNNKVRFYIRYGATSSVTLCKNLVEIDDDDTAYGNISEKLRPVVKLDRSVVFSGDGTSDSPYTF